MLEKGNPQPLSASRDNGQTREKIVPRTPKPEAKPLKEDTRYLSASFHDY